MELIVIPILVIICIVFYLLLLKIDNRTELNYMHYLLENSDSRKEFISECLFNGISQRKIDNFLKEK